MTTAVVASDVAQQVNTVMPGRVLEATGSTLVVRPVAVFEVARWLKANLGFDFLECLTAVDYLQHFEVVYYLLSLSSNQSLVLKTRLQGREGLQVPSVTPLWQGADFQEREAYDLFGIQFDGHPFMKRLFLWEGFPGYPLRKDFL
ncbi:MAG: NADH-quinone oxidoreductase subunit C [Chloroflexi bacterium]|nr:NADH-quinone oxidoreductase subunit C [Chloroflexota bacterium]